MTLRIMMAMPVSLISNHKKEKTREGAKISLKERGLSTMMIKASHHQAVMSRTLLTVHKAKGLQIGTRTRMHWMQDAGSMNFKFRIRRQATLHSQTWRDCKVCPSYTHSNSKIFRHWKALGKDLSQTQYSWTRRTANSYRLHQPRQTSMTSSLTTTIQTRKMAALAMTIHCSKLISKVAKKTTLQAKSSHIKSQNYQMVDLQ